MFHRAWRAIRSDYISAYISNFVSLDPVLLASSAIQMFVMFPMKALKVCVKRKICVVISKSYLKCS